MKHRVSRLISPCIVTAGTVIVVAGSASAPAGHYTVAAGTVTDNKTMLTWQQTISSSTYSLADAEDYCAALDLDGVQWRVPTTQELLSIVDFSVAAPGPAIDSTAFPATPADYFWSSTQWVGGIMGYAVAIDFTGTNGTEGFEASTAYYVRCVQGI